MEMHIFTHEKEIKTNGNITASLASLKEIL